MIKWFKELFANRMDPYQEALLRMFQVKLRAIDYWHKRMAEKEKNDRLA